MAQEPPEQPDMQALRAAVLVTRKETLRGILCEHGLEEDLEKLWRRGVHRVQDLPFQLTWFVVDKEKMRGDIHEYHELYEHEMQKRHSDRYYPPWNFSPAEHEMMRRECLAARSQRTV